MFLINDELREWWVEERDRKIEIVAQRRDPGIPGKCPKECIYMNVCRGLSGEEVDS